MNPQEEQNEKTLLYVAERIFPAHTGQYSMNLESDDLIGTLMYYTTHEYEKGIKSRNEKKLYLQREAVDASTTTIEITKKKMEVFVEDELLPTTEALKKAEKEEEIAKEAKMRKGKERDEAMDRLLREFEEYWTVPMKEVDEQYQQAKQVMDEASVETSEKSDKVKAINTLLREQVFQHKKTTEELRSCLECASKI